VKIDPKAIGVGQYQHDVYQPLLARKLDQVVESCVNHVGVELNTASAPLLARVAGHRPRRRPQHRRAPQVHGPFTSRAGLLAVAGLGPADLRAGRGLRARARRRAPARRQRRAPRALRPRRAHRRRPRRRRRAARRQRDELAAEVVRGKYAGEGSGSRPCATSSPSCKKPGRDPRDRFEPPRFATTSRPSTTSSPA
jgi:uncharacterized protein